ncbi:hypothetical protein Tco_0937384 [Tanacetum coccineum]|uniref:Retrovirus-related Pol polyprotein from transposon TNT 1-94-like beta-barrel domain-containing protein n=1 Tax=Tanacetum coccineum TaxID=301880 RepID=A0ABQ5DEU6_9ASTR
MTETPFVDSGFAVPVFSPGDDLIACLNKAMAFLTTVAFSRFLTTNNQLRTFSNPRNQCLYQMQGYVQLSAERQGQNYSGTTYKNNATSSKRNTTTGQARVVKCYSCQEAQEAGQILDEEQLAFLTDPGIPASQAPTVIPHNAAFQTEDLDTYDSDCDGLSNAQAVLMANISNYGSNVISKVPNSETYLKYMDNQSVHALQDFEQSPVIDFTDNEISSDSNIIPYSQYLQETQHANIQDTNLQAQQDSMILSVIEQMSEQMINHVNNWEKANKEQNIESITAELERYKERVKTFEQHLNIDLSYQNPFYLKKAQRIKPTLYDGVVISNTHVTMHVIDDEETLILEEESRSNMFEKAHGLQNVVQIVLWYLDSGCSKHMTGNRSQLMNFVSKFLGTVRFGNDQIARIMGYGDYQLGNIVISRVYYVEGLGHNLFSVGQFCDADLEVAFWKNTCFIRNLEGLDLLSGSRDTNLYTISLDDMLRSSPICLLSKASKTKSWL